MRALPAALIGAIFAVVLAGQADAEVVEDNPEARIEIAERLVSETLTDKLLNDMSGVAWESLQQNLEDANPGIEPEVIDELRKEFMKFQTDLFDRLMAGLPRVYARHFTTDELQQIYDFQTSPVGRKVIEVQPRIMSQFLPQMMRRMQAEMPSLLRRFETIVRKRGYALEL